MRILGVDPGSRLTGYGCVDLVGNQLRLVTHGTLRLASTSGRAVIPLECRLLLIYEGLSAVIRQFKPNSMAVEQIFFAKNAVSALKLGQARGAVLLTGAIHGLEIVEYSPTEVKARVAGYGRADKAQIAKILQLILGKQKFATNDASDALALAIAHAYASMSSRRSPIIGKSRKRLSLAESIGFAAEVKEGQR